jgi:hypothetical protein
MDENVGKGPDQGAASQATISSSERMAFARREIPEGHFERAEYVELVPNERVRYTDKFWCTVQAKPLGGSYLASASASRNAR